MNIQALLAHVKSVANQLDIRGFLYFCRVADVMTLLKTPDPTDSDACQGWLRTWCSAWRVLRDLGIEGVELGNDNAVKLLGGACQDEVLWQAVHPIVGLILAGKDAEVIASAIKASADLTMRLEFAKAAPYDLYATVLAMADNSRAVA